MKARLKPWRKASKYKLAYRVVACGKTIGIVARDRWVPFGMRRDWSCVVLDDGIRVRRGSDIPRRGDAKRWVVDNYRSFPNRPVKDDF